VSSIHVNGKSMGWVHSSLKMRSRSHRRCRAITGKHPQSERGTLLRPAANRGEISVEPLLVLHLYYLYSRTCRLLSLATDSSMSNQTSQKDSDSYHRSLKRLKLSTLNSRDRHSPQDCFEQTTETISDSVDEMTAELRSRVLHGRELYWYDADLQRANTYVPISLTKGQYEDDQMLYHQTRPWHHLEEELCKLLEKESRLENAQVNAVQYLNTLGSRNVIKAQEDL